MWKTEKVVMQGKFRICMILPYFGKLPSYWEGAVSSFADNPEIDFLVITNCNVEIPPPNLKIINISWREMQNKVKRKFKELGYKRVCISYPYKLCDYKPAYGYLFEEYIRDYDYWGFMDCDLILGRVSNFFPKKFETYCRLFRFGHFSVVKNDVENNRLFTYKNKSGKTFAEVVKTTYPCHFDEVSFNNIYYEKKLPFYDVSEEATFNIWSSEYKWKNKENPELGELFIKEGDGSTWVYYMNPDGTVNKKELMYIHYLSKKGIKINSDIMRPFCIMKRGVYNIDKDRIEDYLNMTTSTPDREAVFCSNLRKKFRKESYKRIIRELKYNHIRSIYYIIVRFKDWVIYMGLGRKLMSLLKKRKY